FHGRCRFRRPRDLGHQASALTVTRQSRSSATGSIDNYPGGTKVRALPIGSLGIFILDCWDGDRFAVIRAFEAHGHKPTFALGEMHHRLT
ncbi:MAG: hypothetical protein V3V97_15550, partial [Hyphomicrobiaceae bacterium]